LADTKAGILNAAKQAFTELGYSGAGLREIAAIANVNSALLVRYFGSKAGLFEAVLIDSVDIGELLCGDREAFGKRVAAHLVDDNFKLKASSLIAFPTNDEIGMQMVVDIKEKYVLQPLIAWLGPPDERARAYQIGLMVAALATYFQQSPLVPKTEGLDESMVAWFAQSVQLIVDRR
jgi:AcrR family transcriptional regulator